MRRKLQLVTGGAVSGVACECVEGAIWDATWATSGTRAAHRHALRRHRPKARDVRCAAATAIARATASVRAAAVRRLAATLASAAVRAMVSRACCSCEVAAAPCVPLNRTAYLNGSR